MENKLNFWNERAETKKNPGSDDFNMKELELLFIKKFIRNGVKVLDIGCGDGGTLIELHNNFKIEGYGIDFSDKMVAKAKKNAGKINNLHFINATSLNLPENLTEFDIILTQRCLINLDSFAEQAQAIENIYKLLKKDAIYIMVESTLDGLEQTNLLRSSIGIEPIMPPWHNLFFRINDLYKLQRDDFKIDSLEHISSTYHFLSRIVYAKLGKLKNEELKYDSDINRLGVSLPQTFGEFGPVKGLIWRKS